MDFSDNGKGGKKNYTGIAVVLALHVVAAYGIVSGLGKRMINKMIEPVETKIIEEVAPPPPKELPPPPPPPEMKAPPPPFIPPVEVQVQQPPPPQNTIANATNVKPASNELARPAPSAPPAPPAPPAQSVRVPAVADFSTCAKPEWPKSSLRNEETGTVTLQFLIGVDGRVMESKVQKSSGFRDLDKAAQTGIGKCRFKPTMVDGKPEQAWMTMQYVWTLE